MTEREQKANPAWRGWPSWSLAVVAVIVYLPHAGYPLLTWDDHFLIIHQDKLGLSMGNVLHWFSHQCIGCYVPLPMLSHMIDYAVGGLDPVAFHAQNALWHALAMVMVYRCLALMKVEWRTAFALALIMALHPQRVESVVWIIERKDVMCAAFYFWALRRYLEDAGDAGKSWRPLILFILACLSKPMAVSFPWVLLMLECHRRRSWRLLAPVKRLWPYFALSAALAVATVFTQDVRGGNVDPTRQALVALHNVFWYIERTLVPISLSPMYPELHLHAEPIWVVGIGLFAFAILIAVTAVRSWKRFRETFKYDWLPLAGGYFFALAPVAGFIQAGAIDYADRYSYIPSAFIWLAVGLIVTRLTSAGGWLETRRPILAVAATVYGCLLLAMNYYHARSWRSPYSLYASASARSPANGIALWQLGKLELERGDWMAAERIAERLRSGRFRKKFLDADQIRGDFIEASARFGKGEWRSAERLFKRIENSPSFGVIDKDDPCGTKMLSMRAECLLREGRVEEAASLHRRLAERFPENEFPNRFHLGLCFFLNGEYAAAAEMFAAARQIRPDDPRATENLRLALERMKNQ